MAFVQWRIFIVPHLAVFRCYLLRQAAKKAEDPNVIEVIQMCFL